MSSQIDFQLNQLIGETIYVKKIFQDFYILKLDLVEHYFYKINQENISQIQNEESLMKHDSLSDYEIKTVIFIDLMYRIIISEKLFEKTIDNYRFNKSEMSKILLS